MKIENRIHKDEEGTALIIVLGLIMLTSLMVLSLVTYSQTSYQLSKITVDRAKSSYWSEGGAARAMWMLRYDIASHPTRSLGKEDEEENSDIDRFLADGTEHILNTADEAQVKVSIFDAVSGIDVSGTRPTRYLRRPESYFDDDDEAYETYKFFLNSVMDYVDTGDFVHANGGFEKEDYEAEGMAPLPRNYQMQFREEILWVPGFADFFSVDQYGRISGIRIIAPKGLRQLTGNNNFFSADPNQMQITSGLDDDQVQEVLDARNSWLSEKTPLSESLTPDVLANVKRRYSFRESGFYTFIIEASPGEGMASRILTCTIQLNRNISNYSELRYYEWRYLR